MEAHYWHQKWDEGKIGFHQPDVNKRLTAYWPRVIQQDSAPADSDSVHDSSCVFVPLCGKSLDMLWLHQQGYRILGVDLSATAAEAFFKENRRFVADHLFGQGDVGQRVLDITRADILVVSLDIALQQLPQL